MRHLSNLSFPHAMRLFITITALLFGGGAALAENYGAIAYSPSQGVRGYSYDYPSRAQAERRAMSECNARGRGCQIATWFKNACGALARGNSGWGASWANSRSAAERKAIRACSQYTGGCRTLVWSCTTR